MRWLRFALLVCFASILQAGFLLNLNINIDLLLILVVFFATHSGTPEAMVSSFILGFAADISVGHTMGPQMLSFGLAGTALAFLHRVIAIRSKPYQAAAIFFVAILAGILTALLNHFKGQHIPQQLYKTILFTALFSGLVGPFLFMPVAWWMRIGINRYRRR